MFLLHMAPLSMLKHIETSQSFIKGSLLWKRIQIIITAYHISHSFSTSITNLLTGRSRYRRAISVTPDVPSMSLTLLTNPFLLAFVATIFATGKLFCSAAASSSRTTSPTFQTSANGVPFLLTLKCYKNFLSLSAAKLVRNVLHSSPIFMTINVWCSKNSRRWHHYS